MFGHNHNKQVWFCRFCEIATNNWLNLDLPKSQQTFCIQLEVWFCSFYEIATKARLNMPLAMLARKQTYAKVNI